MDTLRSHKCCSYRDAKVCLIPGLSSAAASACAVVVLLPGLIFWCKTQVRVFQSKFHNSIHESRHGRRDLMLTTEFQQSNVTHSSISCDCWFNILFYILRGRQMTLITATNLPKEGSCSRKRPLPPSAIHHSLQGTKRIELVWICDF